MDLKFSDDKFSFTITATDEEREELRERLNTDTTYNSDEDTFIDFIEYYLCNGHLEIIRPEEVSALTDSFLFAEFDETDRDDMGELLKVGKVYWYRDSQIRGYTDALIEDGRITFHADGE